MDFLWIPMDPYGFPCGGKDFLQDPRKSIGIHRNPKEIHQNFIES